MGEIFWQTLMGLLGAAGAGAVVVLGVIGALLGILGGFKVFFDDARSFRELRIWLLRGRAADRYHKAIGALLAWADRTFDPAPAFSIGAACRLATPAGLYRIMGSKAFDKCLRVALLYPVFLFSVAWLFGGTGYLAEVSILPERDGDGQPLSLFNRLWRWGAFVLGAIFIAAYVVAAPTFVNWIVNRLRHRLARAPLPTRAIRYLDAVVSFVTIVMVVGVVGVVVLVGGAAFVASAVVIGVAAGGVVVGGAVAVAIFAFGLSGSFGVVVAGVMVGVSGALVAVLGGGAFGVGVAAVASVAIAVLYVLLPFLNAFMDLASLQVSRVLIRHMVRHQGPLYGVGVALHVVADLFLAAAFLVLLAVLLPVVLQATNHGIEALGNLIGMSSPPIDWVGMVTTAQKDPFGAGLMVTGMLATTLVPTAVHLVAALVALAFPRLGGRTFGVIARQRVPSKGGRFGFAMLYGVTVFGSFTALALAGMVLWSLGAAVWQANHLAGLADLAYWAGRLIGGPGAPPPL